jgi:anti-sigma regulatory factor (Ser/Thr protein kinase)
LVTHEGRLGCLQLDFGEREAPAEDVLRALVSRVAIMLQDSLAFEREQRASFAFQYAALTSDLPALPEYRLDAVYEAGRSDALIGGDWYDAFVLPDGRLVVTIGDVVGSGLRAAVAMVQVRQSLRTIAQVHADPALMLEAANRTLLEEFPDRFVTTFVGLLDPITQTCAYAGAGHPPPLLRLPDGAVIELPCTGIPLGVDGFTEHLRVGHLTLTSGSVLVLYTDGVIETERRPIEGAEELRRRIGDMDTAAISPAKALYRRVLPAGARDDVAILTICVEAQPQAPRWRFDPRWRDVAHRARTEILASLSRAGIGEDRAFAFEVLFAEILGNLVRHAPGTAEVVVQERADAFVIHVLDKGPGFQFAPRLPNDLFSENGRGLYLISKLADGLSVDHRPGGGTHTRITLSKPKGAHTQ